MGVGKGKSLGCLLEKACIAVIGVLRVILLRAQKRGPQREPRLPREFLHGREQNVGESMDGEGRSDEVSDGSMLLGTGGKRFLL